MSRKLNHIFRGEASEETFAYLINLLKELQFLQELKLLQRNLSLQNYYGDKVGARAALVNKFTGFCRMSVTPSLLHLSALLRDDL